MPVGSVNALMAAGFTPNASLYLPIIQNPHPLLETGYLLITEVMYHPLSGSGEVEWIEIMNASRAVADLRDYKIGDEETSGGSEGMLRFPVGSTLLPGDVIVVVQDAVLFEQKYGFSPDYEFRDSGSEVPDMVKYTAWTGGSVSLTNTGEEVLLLDRFDNVMDSVSWGSSTWAFDPAVGLAAPGQSIERLPGYFDSDTAADWIAQVAPTPGRIALALPVTPSPTPTMDPTSTPFVAGLVISEVLYDPVGTEPGAEWFEIHNPTANDLELSGIKIGDEELNGGSEGMFAFPVGSVIAAEDVAVIANDAAVFISEYGFSPDYEIKSTVEDVPDLEKYALWSGGSLLLSNSGDELVLLNSFDEIIDAVSWENSTWAFDPAVSEAGPGVSLERYPSGLDTDRAIDWRLQNEPTPGNVSP